ncbi:MAG: hypothetical protein ACT4OZ_10800 [Gemmatimonadota bacterium]
MIEGDDEDDEEDEDDEDDEDEEDEDDEGDEGDEDDEAWRREPGLRRVGRAGLLAIFTVVMLGRKRWRGREELDPPSDDF